MEIRELTDGLQFPEGPVALPDGSVLVCEIRRGTLTRVLPDGACKIVAETGGGPNGAAVGADGKVYVCNNGGDEWTERAGLMVPSGPGSAYRGGSIQRVDIETGEVETLYSECDGIPLKGPNDIAIDAEGGLWITDFGKTYERHRDVTGVLYASPDGSSIREVIFPLEGPNGIGLSPDGTRLYVAESIPGRLWAWEITGPGEIAPVPGLLQGAGTLVAGVAGMQLFDSLGVDAEGGICVATIRNTGDGGITSISPDGETIEFFPMPDPIPTNICWGGPERRIAYVTLSASGRLVACDWPRPGLKLNF